MTSTLSPSVEAITNESPSPSQESARVVLFDWLKEITQLSGDPFLKCWWDTVLCHYDLARRGIEHHDITPSNLMYKRDGDTFVGVLIDYDALAPAGLRATEDRYTSPSIFTPLCPLTTKGLADNTDSEHVYAHDAEAFIWVLTWVCICYDGNDLCESSQSLEDCSLGLVMIRSGIKRQSYRLPNLEWVEKIIMDGKRHEQSWRVAKRCLQVLCGLAVMSSDCETPPQTDKSIEGMFQTLLNSPFRDQSGDRPLSRCET